MNPSSPRAHTQLASHCSARTPSENALYRTSLSEDDSIDGATFFKDSKGWLILSLFGAALVGVLFLALFRSFARQTVWGIIYLKVAALGTVGAYALCTDGGAIVGGILLALTAFTAFVFYLWRNEIELVARLLAVAVGSSSRPWVYPCFRWFLHCLGWAAGNRPPPCTSCCYQQQQRRYHHYYCHHHHYYHCYFVSVPYAEAKSLQDNPHVITAVIFLKLCLLCVLVPLGEDLGFRV